MRTCINLERLLDVAELEGVAGVRDHLAGPGELFHQRYELVVVAAVVEHLDLPDELHLDALVL